MSLARLLWRGHSDMLAAWPTTAYRLRSFEWRVPGWRLLVVNNGRAAHRVLVDQAAHYHKGALANFALRPLLGNGLLLNEGEPWRRRRRQLLPLFDSAALPAFAETVVEAGAHMLDRWAELPPGTEVELGQELSAVTAEVICRHHLGASLGDLAGPAFAAFGSYQRALDRILPYALFGLPLGLLQRLNRSGRAAAGRLEQVVTELAQRAPPAGVNLVGLLAASGAGPTERRDELLTFFLAGHETTALALCWALLALGRNPAVERRLQQEVDTVLGTRLPDLQDYERLSYTRAVLAEALRLYPPLPILPRQAQAPQEVDGIQVRSGAEVLVVPWLAHRHRGYWPEAETFKPDRFLGEGLSRRQRDGYLPFGAGPRFCPGHRLGLVEGSLLLALVARRFSLRAVRATAPRPLALLSLRPSGGLPMTLWPRP